MCRIYQSLSESVQNISETSPVEVLTLCPCPPETAKPALVAVDGGILTPNGNFLDLTDLSKSQIKMMAYSYASNAYPVNGSAMPDNLE